MKEWQERFQMLYADAFALAERRCMVRPLHSGEAVTVMVDGRVNDRAMTLLTVEGDEAVVEGYVDGAPQEPIIERMPMASLVRAQDILEILLDLGQQRGLDRPDEPAEHEQRH